VKALDYLTASNRKGFGDEVPSSTTGDAERQGQAGGRHRRRRYRDGLRAHRDPAGREVGQMPLSPRPGNMPGSQREVQNAEEEGVEFVWLSAPKAFDGTDAVEQVRVSKMRLGAPDASGRRAPEE
jgi:glutamate synthase (NADPH/NADH) small chain